MNGHSVPSHTWTPIPDTGVSVYQNSGSVQMIVVHDGQVELPTLRAVTWRVRSHIVPTDITSWKDKEFTVWKGQQGRLHGDPDA